MRLAHQRRAPAPPAAAPARAADAQEAIYSQLLMMQRGLAAASANIDTLEAAWGLTEGDLKHGQPILDQIMFMRPMPGWSDHRTPGADAS